MRTAAARSRFASEMYLAVREESALWELPTGSTDLLRSGTVRHGPWAPRDCAAVIRAWMDRGWVELYLPELPPSWELRPARWLERAVHRGGFRVLATADAHDLLDDPTRWAMDDMDGQVCLSCTSTGLMNDEAVWLAAVSS